MSAFSSYTGSFTLTVSDSPQAAAPNSALPFGTPANSTTMPLKSSYVIGGNVVKGVNEVASNVLTISASGSATLNLQSLTDMLGTTGVVLVRLKRYVFWLLSANDDATAGTACSAVVIGGGSNPCLLGMGGTTPTMTLNGNTSDSGDKWCYASTTATGITVGGSSMNVLCTNSDSSHTAALYYNVAGSTT